MSQYGLKDIHFAILETDTKSGVSYDDVEEILGAINAKINPNVNTQELYADDQLWESISALGKIEVEIETADLPLKTRAKVLGNKYENGILIENKDDTPPYLALGFKSLRKGGKYRYVWLLKGVAQPMGEDFTTKKDNVEHKTPVIKFTFMPRNYDGDWKRTADEDSLEFTGANSWFREVPIDSPPLSPADKSELLSAIGVAQNVLETANIGTGVGEYPEGDYEVFSNAIDDAQIVANNDNATQKEVDKAKVNLSLALLTFQGTKILE
ncbi:MAG: Phage tail protein [Xylanivirga thermophila]|jgi:phi13 family phage major tail protein|uniref:major tail protein n=1 Tax=Xylanivirga thermophila TaxID=2496273 RepID=UPI0039F58D8D